MTKKQFKEKFGEITKGLESHIQKKAKDLIDSGAVDLKDYGDDNRLPKIILQAVLRDAAENFKSPHPLDKGKVENLLKF